MDKYQVCNFKDQQHLTNYAYAYIAAHNYIELPLISADNTNNYTYH